MFTGIIEELGRITHIRKQDNSYTLTITCQKVLEDIHLGDSISVNGVCLTVTAFTKSHFKADIMPESVEITTFKEAKIGSIVNLERALSVQSRFGGHIVAGHVDGVGVITTILPRGNSTIYRISCKSDMLTYIVHKGSIAVDGISLTVSSVGDGNFEISIIPHTIGNTTLKFATIGQKVNLETDILGRYIHNFLQAAPHMTRPVKEEKHKKNTLASSLTKETLLKNGFI